MKKQRQYILFFICSALLLLIVSRCSFLYPFSDEGDVNTFLAASKYMMSGKVLYSDFFEHKGPIIYFLHIIALTIIPNSFHGIYILEVIAVFFYFVFTYKTIKLVNDSKDTTFITIIACSSSYAVQSIMHGDQVEEFCLPIFAYLIYNIVNYIKNNEVKKKTFFISGLLVGLIFWTKYTILLPYSLLVLYFIVLCIIRKDYKTIKNLFIYSLIGISIIMILMMIYFKLTNSFNDMVDIYFVENIFGYKEDKAIVKNNPLASILLLFSSNFLYMKYIGWFYLIVLFVLTIYFKPKDTQLSIFKFLIYGYFSTWICISLLGVGWAYYFIDHTVYYGLILTFFWLYIKKNIVKNITKIVLPIIVIISIFLNTNLSDYNYNVKVIREISDTIGNKQFRYLNNLDYGLYYINDYLPDDYYFTTTNARYTTIIHSIMKKIENNSLDYVIVVNEDTSEFDKFNDYMNNYNYKICYNNQLISYIKQSKFNIYLYSKSI